MTTRLEAAAELFLQTFDCIRAQVMLARWIASLSLRKRVQVPVQLCTASPSNHVNASQSGMALKGVSLVHMCVSECCKEGLLACGHRGCLLAANFY